MHTLREIVVNSFAIEGELCLNFKQKLFIENVNFITINKSSNYIQCFATRLINANILIMSAIKFPILKSKYALHTCEAFKNYINQSSKNDGSQGWLVKGEIK